MKRLGAPLGKSFDARGVNHAHRPARITQEDRHRFAVRTRGLQAYVTALGFYPFIHEPRNELSETCRCVVKDFTLELAVIQQGDIQLQFRYINSYYASGFVHRSHLPRMRALNDAWPKLPFGFDEREVGCRHLSDPQARVSLLALSLAGVLQPSLLNVASLALS